jgi:hypothetical protein
VPRHQQGSGEAESKTNLRNGLKLETEMILLSLELVTTPVEANVFVAVV